MAESLIDLADPLAGILAVGPNAPVGEVVSRIAHSLAPIEKESAAPGWLRPEQVAPFRRALAAIERYRGALLADPVGSGKTYIALAVAAALAEPTVAIVPASLKEQWHRAATELGVPITLHSHEALSRGRLPDPRSRLALVDESHRFRSAGIRRYRELARWLVGKRVLLLSATPVVNRLADLANQLRLGIRDDALAARGVASLSAILGKDGQTDRRTLKDSLVPTRASRSQGDSVAGGQLASGGALGDVVLCRAIPAGRPRTRETEIHWSATAFDQEVVEAIDRLALSQDRGTAALIRMVLWRALASSRPALLGALDRYARLLDHATQASTLGRSVSRAEIRSFTDGALDQLVMWEVLPNLTAPADLILEDRPALDRLTARLKSADIDPRIAELRAVLSDRRTTLVFTSSRDTLEALRSALEDLRPAWVHGAGAGIGHTRMDRESVLDEFRPGGSSLTARPSALLATDLAAEGLNLQLAQRIVHFDLPWTSVRIDQREGRAVRLGSTNREVEIVRFSPWPALEVRLRQAARLLTKRRLATHAGLDDEGRWLYRWRTEIGEGMAYHGEHGGFAVAQGENQGWLLGLAFDLMLPDGSVRPEPASLLWVEPSGVTIEAPELVVGRLLALRSSPTLEPSGEDREAASRVLIAVTRERLHAAQHCAWLTRQAPPEQRKLARRMRRVASEAARQRNRKLLDLADRALDWLAGGVTAGEAALVSELADAPVRRLHLLWPTLLRTPRVRMVPVPRVTGVVRCVACSGR